MDILDSSFDSKTNIYDNEPGIPITAIIGSKTEAIQFTFDLFHKRPEMFGEKAEPLLYAYYAGNIPKAESCYTVFEHFVRNRNDHYIAEIGKSGVVANPYQYDIDNIISWARVIKSTGVTMVFEPVMKLLNNTLDNWNANPYVSVNGKSMYIGKLKPLCYNSNGECFVDLLPSICYIMTFLIHCRPYSFAESMSEASRFTFYTALNSWFNSVYITLGKDTDLDILKASPADLNLISSELWNKALSTLLDPNRIIDIRNEQLKATPGYFEDCVASQNVLTQSTVDSAWDKVMTQLVAIILRNGPIKRIVDGIPPINTAVNVDELFRLVEWCLGGSPNSICEVNGDYYYYCDDLQDYPAGIFKGGIKTGIPKYQLSIGIPFEASDIMLQLATAYTKQKWIERTNDLLDSDPIVITGADLRADVPFSDYLNEFYTRSAWNADNGPMSSALRQLTGFKDELDDILALGEVVEAVYTNRMAATVIMSLILSRFPEWLLSDSVAGRHLFHPHVYIAAFDPKDSESLIRKLSDITVSMLYLLNPRFVSFVNTAVSDFTRMFTATKYTYQIYGKGLADSAEYYAIGGGELYNYTKYTNPLLRGLGFIFTVYGMSDKLKLFWDYALKMTNTSAFDVINDTIAGGQSEANNSIIVTLLTKQFDDIVKSNKGPAALGNYTFSGNKAAYTYPVTKLINETLSLITANVLPQSYAKNTVNKHIITRRLYIDTNGDVAIGKPVINGFDVDGSTYPVKFAKNGTDETIPLLEYHTTIKDEPLIYTSPKGLNCVKLLIDSPRLSKNNAVWLFTDQPLTDRFQNYKSGFDTVSSVRNTPNFRYDRVPYGSRAH